MKEILSKLISAGINIRNGKIAKSDISRVERVLAKHYKVNPADYDQLMLDFDRLQKTVESIKVSQTANPSLKDEYYKDMKVIEGALVDIQAALLNLGDYES